MAEHMDFDIYDDLPEMPEISVYSNKSSTSLPTSCEGSTSASTTNEVPNSSSSEHNVNKTDKKCVCLENILWTWDNNNKSENVEILDNNVEVLFNKRYSTGTAVVRCTEPMSDNQYFWEIKMTYPVYGTDIMIGVGTSEARIAYLTDRYVSRLGMDEETWGFSCHGMFHHNGVRSRYAQKFDQGNIIGVHLDLWKGTLSFYKNRKHLGVASSGLKGKTLYAMASSTAACSGMRIVRACCFPSSLQFLCAARLRDLVPGDKNVLDVIRTPPGLKLFLQNNLSWLLEKPHQDDDFKTCCMSDSKSKCGTIHYDPYTDIRKERQEFDPGTENMFAFLSSLIQSTNGRRDDSERSPKRLRKSIGYVDLSDYDSD